MQTFYRRPLPTGQIPFASPEGRQVFGEALASGHLGSWFPLAQNFHTQADPAFCGLGTLVMVLNALEIDPGRLWKGPWRWFGEELLDCCKSLDQVRAGGISLEELACLARCNGARVRVRHAAESDLEMFRADLRASATAPDGPFLVVNYARGVLGQTGSGHFSPVAGLHADRDLALILDVARFKYPPHWAPVEVLWASMLPIDEDTGRSRGWAVLERSPLPVALAFRLEADPGSWSSLVSELQRVFAALEDPADAMLTQLVEGLPFEVRGLVGVKDGADPAHGVVVETALAHVRQTRLYARLGELAPTTAGLEALAILLWVWPGEEIAAIREAYPAGDLDPVLRQELEALTEQARVLERFRGSR